MIFTAFQLTGEYTLQLLIIDQRKRNMICQLVDGKGISVFIYISVYLGPISLKVISGIQRNGLLPVDNRISEPGNNTFLLTHWIHPKSESTAAVLCGLF